MKNQITVTAVLLLTLFILISLSGIAQEKEKEKQVRIKTVKVEDGKKVVKDTTFTVKEGEDVKEIVEGLSWTAEADSIKMTVDVTIDDDGKGGKKIIIMSNDGDEDVKVIHSEAEAFYFSEGDSLMEIKVDVIVDEECAGRGKKVIIIKKDGDEEIVKEIFIPHHRASKKVIKFKSDDGEEIIIVTPHGHHKSMKWESEDGHDYDFDFDYDMDFDHDKFKAEMKEHMMEMESARVIVLDEKMTLLDELEELENMEIEIIRSPRLPKHHDYTMRRMERFNKVTDKELRDAGIKNKPDRLELDNINIDLNKGVIDLIFTMKGEGSPKIEVYNFFGDKVFSGKPELLNGSYKSIIDLSTKQHGTYYLQIINKNSSFTEKIRL